MRCMGLTSERRRCANETINGTGYCERHQRESASIASAVDSVQAASTRGFFGFRRKRPHRLFPNDAQLGVPGWLKRLSTETVVDHLLHDQNSTRRWFAAYALRRRRDPAAIEPLWRALQFDVFSMVRQQSAVALGKIGTPAVQNPLIESLWHDPDAAVRQACAVALGNLGYRFAAPDLADVLAVERAAFVRWDCAVALAQIGGNDVTGILSELATKDQAEVVRNACREALAVIRSRS